MITCIARTARLAAKFPADFTRASSSPGWKRVLAANAAKTALPRRPGVRIFGGVALIECRISVEPGAVPAVERVLAETETIGWSLYEDVVARRAWLIGIFDGRETAGQCWRAMRDRLPRGGVGDAAWRELPDVDWRDSYKAHFKAWRCGPLHWVPEWERATHRVPRGHGAVYLDPGLAFGTGNHETTRLCCRRLVEFARGLSPQARRTWRVIDAGCGSGILAISAAKLGCAHVFAFDNDPEAVAVARENVRRNRVASSVRIGVGMLEPMLQRRRAELVLANIQADVLMAHARELIAAVAPGGQLVLSGILGQEFTSVRETFARMAPHMRSASRTLGEWADLRLAAPPTRRRN